uniref:hypothetical protein n=1 Tax=Lysinibacillus sp. D4A3_S15 TaxID=2941227 RepID=UPI0020BFCED5
IHCRECSCKSKSTIRFLIKYRNTQRTYEFAGCCGIFFAIGCRITKGMNKYIPWQESSKICLIKKTAYGYAVFCVEII